MEEEKLDFRVEIRILQFWRRLLGEANFAKFRQEDLLRWHQAFELAGPTDIREHLMERRNNHTLSHLHGIVDLAPHPPTWLVEEWLSSHEAPLRTAPFWYGLAAFTIVCFITGLTASTCSVDYTINPLALNPQPVEPKLATPGMQGAGAFSVGNLTQTTPYAPTLPSPAPATTPYPSVISIQPPAAGKAGGNTASTGTATTGATGH